MRTSALTKILVTLCLAGFIAGIAAPDLGAQYYGRNKVQYQKFDFKIMKTRHFDVYFYLQDEQTVKMACLMAERWYARLSRMFNHELKGRQPLILYGSSPEFQQTTVIPGHPGRGDGRRHRVVQAPHRPALRGLAVRDRPRHRPRARPRLPVRHHGPGPLRPGPGQRHRPCACRSGSSRAWPSTCRSAPSIRTPRCGCATPSARKELPQLKKLDNSYKYFPYRCGQAVWAYITGRWGDEVIGKMMKSVGRTGDYEIILESMLGIKLKQLSADWHKSMQDAYAPVLEKTQPVGQVRQGPVQGDRDRIPTISPRPSAPTASRIIFLSTRDLFSIDLYLADAEKGTIRRKIISTAVDPHFESIQFIKSAGSWDADGEKFVFGGVSKGRPGPDHRRYRKGTRSSGRSPSRSWPRSSARPSRRTAATSPSPAWPAASRPVHLRPPATTSSSR